MNVSDATKNEYRSSSVHKNLTIKFPELGLTIDNTKIYQESMKLKESILEKNNIEFVGCIASSFSVQIQGLKEDVKGKKIEASITTDGSNDEPIPLFHGIVDSAVLQDNRLSKTITAYDILYTKGNTEVSSWYNSLTFPISIKKFRDSLFTYIGITQDETSLVNDDISISKQYDPKTLKALNVIKAICQINGVFGIINRDGIFEYRTTQSGLYPSGNLYPSVDLYPFSGEETELTEEEVAEAMQYYKKIRYEEFKVKPVDKITIRQNENDAGVTYGSGTNNYIIQGNMFTYGLSNETLLQMAQNIYPYVEGYSYYPFQASNMGLPFVECGVDILSYKVRNLDTGETEKKYYNVFSRELSGIQALSDSYTAKGEEYQSEFITDLQTSIDLIKQQDQQYQKTFNDFDSRISKLEAGGGGGGGSGGINIVSVASLPSNPDSNTVYLIQGIVVVE